MGQSATRRGVVVEVSALQPLWMLVGQPQFGRHLHAAPHWQVAPQQHDPSTLLALPPHAQLGLAQRAQAQVSLLPVIS